MDHDPIKVNDADLSSRPAGGDWLAAMTGLPAASHSTNSQSGAIFSGEAPNRPDNSSRQSVIDDPDLGPIYVSPMHAAPDPAPERPADPLPPAPDAPPSAEAPGAPDSGPQGPPDLPPPIEPPRHGSGPSGRREPDMAMAAKFLRALDATAPGWTFQTFDDSKPPRKELARVLHGSLAGHARALADLQAEGAGVFVTVNETDLTGRSRANVTRVRAFFVDLDGAPLEPVREWLEPHIIVESSRGRWHAYWLVSDCPLDAFTGIQKRLIAAFGSDGAVHDLPRVMRLPGFWHLKGEPLQLRLCDTAPHAPAYALADFEARLAAREVELALVVPSVAVARPLAASAVPLDDPMNLGAAIRYLQAEAPPAIEGQGGDDATFRATARLRAMGISEAVACDLMAEHYNPRCTPPWEPEALAQKVANGFSYAQNAPGTEGPAVVAQAFAGAVPLETIVPEKTEPPLMWAADLFSLPEPDWLIEDLIPESGVGLLAGQSRIGKSFVALDMARSIMTGEAFFGHEVCQRGGVLIAAAEAPESLSSRIKALCHADHPNGPLDPKALPLVVLPLSGREQLPRLVARTAEAMRARGVKLRLVIVDTIAAGYRVSDENDAGQATEAMQHLAAGARAFGGFMLGVHHFGKNGASGARGSSAWTASADVILAATGIVDDETGSARDRKLALTKSRSAPTKTLSHFTIADVVTGQRRNGKEARGGFVQVLADSPTATTGKPPKRLEALLDAFDQVADDHTIPRNGQLCIPQTFAREIFDARVRPEYPSASSCRNAWSRALKFALETRQLRVADGVPHAFILDRYPTDDS